MTQKNKIIHVHCESIEQWRTWLEKNHLKEKEVALIVNKKHTGKGTISHLDSMKEAICFGWIDTIIKRLDDNRYIRHFRKRTDKSTWSDNTLRYAKELLEKSKMSPEGLKRYEEGLSRPTLDHKIPKNPKTPKDVKKEVEKNKLIKQFKKLSKSQKKMHLRNIIRAKTQETRKNRTNKLINLLMSKINKASSTFHKKQTSPSKTLKV